MQRYGIARPRPDYLRYRSLRGDTVRYRDGQLLIGSGPAGSLLYAYAAKPNSRVHN